MLSSIVVVVERRAGSGCLYERQRSGDSVVSGACCLLRWLVIYAVGGEEGASGSCTQMDRVKTTRDRSLGSVGEPCFLDLWAEAHLPHCCARALLFGMFCDITLLFCIPR